MDLSTLLLMAQGSPDPIQRTEALQRLKTMEDTNKAEFLVLLSLELADPSKSAQARALAGLILKNTLDAREELLKEQKTQEWLVLADPIRSQIKERALNSLSSDQKEVRKISAQVVSRIGIIELPQHLWPQLVGSLVDFMMSPNAGLRQSTLETLGYICEETDQTAIRDYSNKILTAVVQGMRKEEVVDEVRLAGATALLGALEFAKPNFEKEDERNYLMTVICEGTIAKNDDIKSMSLQCLVKIATLYYDKISSWMQNIFNITIAAINKTEEEIDQNVALQAVEFWSTLCDTEMDIMMENEEYAQMKIQSDKHCQHFIKGSLKYLIPILCEALTKQEDEDQDEDAWNVSTAAGNALSLISNTVQDDVVQHIMPFVQKNIASENWRYREAAVLAFGSMLEGPRAPMMKDLVREELSPAILLSKLNDNVVLVKYTAAWTLGRICTFYAPVVAHRVQDVVGVFMQSLKDKPRIASKVCWAIHNLASELVDSEETGSTPLSACFNDLVQLLLHTTERPDANESFLGASAYETLNVLIQNSGKDCSRSVDMLVPIFLDRLTKSYGLTHMGIDRQTVSALQGHLCGALQSCTIALEGQISKYSDQLMHAYLQVFEVKTSTVHEEALMAVGALADALESDFARYMRAFHPWLESALKNWEEHQVCSVAVGVVGDVSRALGDQMSVYCDSIVPLLLDNLRNPNINRDVKPPILSCFGDMALAIGGKFEKYLATVMNMELQASATVVKDLTDYDFVDYVNLLRENILEAYTSIIQGLRSDDKADLFLPYVEQVLTFVASIWQDNTRSEAVTRGAVGVLGDLGHSLGPRVKNYLHNNMVQTIINECSNSPNPQTKELATWTKSVISSM